MSDVEIINGAKFINGYLCDEAGRPITQSNGYSSDDEHYAHQSYVEAKSKYFSLKQMSKEEMLKEEESYKDYLEQDALQLSAQENQQGYVFVNGLKTRNGKLVNDMGEEISEENGYSSEDERFSVATATPKRAHFELPKKKRRTKSKQTDKQKSTKTKQTTLNFEN